MKQLAITALLALAGMGTKAQTGEYRQPLPYTGIEVKNGIEVVITQSDIPSLKVESDNGELLDNIVTEFKGNTLKIYIAEDGKVRHGLSTAKVYITQKNITDIKASTGSSIKVSNKFIAESINLKLYTGATFTGILETKSMRVKAASGSVFRGIVNTGKFDGDISGGATIKVTGTSNMTTVTCNSGVLQAGKLKSEKANVTAFNAASAFVNAVQSIKINTDSSSSVTYYGEPADVALSENTYSIRKDSHKFALN